MDPFYHRKRGRRRRAGRLGSGWGGGQGDQVAACGFSPFAHKRMIPCWTYQPVVERACLVDDSSPISSSSTLIVGSLELNVLSSYCSEVLVNPVLSPPGRSTSYFRWGPWWNVSEPAACVVPVPAPIPAVVVAAAVAEVSVLVTSGRLWPLRRRRRGRNAAVEAAKIARPSSTPAHSSSW